MIYRIFKKWVDLTKNYLVWDDLTYIVFMILIIFGSLGFFLAP